MHADLALGRAAFFRRGFTYVAPISWAGWPGPVKGIEFRWWTAFAVVFASPCEASNTEDRLRVRPVWHYAVSTIVGAACSHAVDLLRLAAILTRGAVPRSISALALSPQRPALGSWLALVIGPLQPGDIIVSWDIAATGQTQAGGWFGHQNNLGFATHFVVYPALAALMGGYYPKRMLLAVVSGVLIAFAGASRATIGLMLLGMVLTLLFSSMHQINSRKMAVAGGALIALLAVSPILYSSLQRRTAEHARTAPRSATT